jgi:hypothetical protein
MSQERPRYISYLLRMWQVKGKRGWVWRASLESPGSGRRNAFPSLDRLIAFLLAQAGRQESEESVKDLDDSMRKRKGRIA